MVVKVMGQDGGIWNPGEKRERVLKGHTSTTGGNGQRVHFRQSD